MVPDLAALAAFMASALETPAYGPHESGIVYLLLPPLGLQMLILCIASMARAAMASSRRLCRGAHSLLTLFQWPKANQIVSLYLR